MKLILISDKLLQIVCEHVDYIHFNCIVFNYPHVLKLCCQSTHCILACISTLTATHAVVWMYEWRKKNLHWRNNFPIHFRWDIFVDNFCKHSTYFIDNCVPLSMPMTDWLVMDGQVISRTTVNHKYQNSLETVYSCWLSSIFYRQCVWDLSPCWCLPAVQEDAISQTSLSLKYPNCNWSLKTMLKFLSKKRSSTTVFSIINNEKCTKK